MVSKAVLDKVPPFTVSFLRFFIAAMALYAMIKLKRAPLGKIDKKDYKYLFLIGFFGYFLSIGLQLLGTELSSASVASLINSMVPVAVMFFAAVMLGEKFTLKKFICIFLAVSGTYVIMGGAGDSGSFMGAAVSVVSVSLWAFASVIVRKVSFKYDTLVITFYCVIIGMVFTAPAAAFEISVTDYVRFDAGVIAALLYMGLICTALGYILWNRGLASLEAGTCALFYPVQPLTSALLGALFLHEAIGVNFIAGACLIISGVLLTVIGGRK